jgi:hypothetical protein
VAAAAGPGGHAGCGADLERMDGRGHCAKYKQDGHRADIGPGQEWSQQVQRIIRQAIRSSRPADLADPL